MRHSQISRISAKALLAIVGLSLAGACADSTSAPAPIVSADVPAGYNTIVGVQTFRYTPRSGANARLGAHVLVMPSGSVCDPATSTYGIGYWDDPCTPVRHAVDITATTREDDAGHPYVSFSPDLRFVPGKDVELYLKDGRRPSPDALAIVWCPTGSTSCIDESPNDPSLVTERVGRSSTLKRRLKHVSGYNIAANGSCDPANQVMLDDGSMGCVASTGSSASMSRSGYILASGLGRMGSSDIFGRHRKPTPSQ